MCFSFTAILIKGLIKNSTGKEAISSLQGSGSTVLLLQQEVVFQGHEVQRVSGRTKENKTNTFLHVWH